MPLLSEDELTQLALATSKMVRCPGLAQSESPVWAWPFPFSPRGPWEHTWSPPGSGRYFGRHGDLADAPRMTHTAEGHPGDPLNLGLVGTDEQVVRAMTAIAWFPADPITFRSSIRIAVDCGFRKPDESAPVSPER